MLEGALIALAAFLLGRALPGRRKGPGSPKLPEAVCGCTHHHAYHDPGTGECKAAVRGSPLSRNQYGNWDAWEQAPCACRKYSGPLPLPEVYAPEIGG